jgi:hypothetical protein
MDNLGNTAPRQGFPFTVDSKASHAGDSFDMGEAAGYFAYIEDPDGTLIEFVETHKVPILKKFGWYLDMRRRDPQQATAVMDDQIIEVLTGQRQKQGSRQQAIGSSENTGYQAVSVTMMSTLLPIAYCLLNTPCCLHFLHDPHEVPSPDLGNIITAVSAADQFLRDILHHGDVSAVLEAAAAVEISSYAHIVDTDHVNTCSMWFTASSTVASLTYSSSVLRTPPSAVPAARLSAHPSFHPPVAQFLHLLIIGGIGLRLPEIVAQYADLYHAAVFLQGLKHVVIQVSRALAQCAAR